jgi:Protein of unknown function (DUF3237)
METPATTQPALELIPLGKLHLRLAPAMVLENTPAGTLMIIELTEGELESDRVKARMTGKAAADWLTAGPNGVASFDVRLTLQTEDGALIYTHYTGRGDLSQGPPLTPYSAFYFETGDPRYAWLAKMQAVGKGRTDAELTRVSYDLYELR